jgi:purine nucleosidase
MTDGANGVGGLTLPTAAASVVAESAAEMLVRLARLYPGTLRVLAIGPLTNIAEASGWSLPCRPWWSRSR